MEKSLLLNGFPIFTGKERYGEGKDGGYAKFGREEEGVATRGVFSGGCTGVRRDWGSL